MQTPIFSQPYFGPKTPQFRFTNISPGDILRTFQSLSFSLSDKPLDLLRTALFSVGFAQFIKTGIQIPDVLSYLGTPVYDSILFGDLNATPTQQTTQVNTVNNNQYTDPVTGITKYINSIRLNEALITVSVAKTSVDTPRYGGMGTIKDYISSTDYIINIKGKISGDYNNVTNNWEQTYGTWNSQSQKWFADLAKYNIEIPITCQFLNEVFQVYNVVIKNIELAETEGARNNPTFSISCLSDFKGADGKYDIEIYDDQFQNDNDINAFVNRINVH